MPILEDPAKTAGSFLPIQPCRSITQKSQYYLAQVMARFATMLCRYIMTFKDEQNVARMYDRYIFINKKYFSICFGTTYLIRILESDFCASSILMLRSTLFAILELTPLPPLIRTGPVSYFIASVERQNEENCSMCKLRNTDVQAVNILFPVFPLTKKSSADDVWFALEELHPWPRIF